MTKAKPKGAGSRRDPNVYPPGWNRARTEAVIAHYDAVKETDVLGKDAAAGGLVWMEVPEELVASVKKLIAGRRKSA